MRGKNKANVRGKPAGVTLGRGEKGQLVTLREDSLHHHTHQMGVSGSGKSRSIISRFLQLHNQRVGCAFIDPHGDACDHIVGLLADQGYFDDERAFTRMLYLDFGRPDRFLRFNFLAQPYDSHHKARLVWEAFTRVWPSVANGQAPMMQEVILGGVLVLSQNQEPLTALERLYTNQEYRAQLLARAEDAQAQAFFRRFEAMGRGGNALIESALRRLFLLSFSPALLYSLGQRDNLLDFRRIIDTPGIGVLCNLSGLDADSQRLLAALLMIGFEEAALSRSNVTEDKRAHFHLMCDEFPAYSAQSGVAFERMLAQARKFHLTLLLAHQTWSQVDASALQGALQNACFVAHRLGPDDAAWAAKRLTTIDPERLTFSPRGTASWMSETAQYHEVARQLVALPTRQALMRLGEQTVRLETVGVPDPACSTERLTAIKEEYARRLLTPKATVEAQMAGASLPSGDEAHKGAPPGATAAHEIPTRRARRRVPLDESSR